MKHDLVRSVLVVLGLAFLSAGSEAQQRTIRGTVVDSATAAPVQNATVQVQDTQIGTLTDEDGSFVLRGAPEGDVTLLVRRIGYQRHSVRVPAGQNQVTVRVRRSYVQMDELVVTGRATQMERRNLATSVGSVSGDQVTETSQQTVDKALQGRVSGATISQNSGAPGGGVQVQLRGPSSVFARSAPLYVVDGVLVSDESIAPNANAITSAATGSNPSLDQDNQQNRIADLNPEDIESIEVLKGPAAAAIYGQKAANGVIIIETKRGTSGGGPEWRVSARGGIPDNSNKIGSRKFESRQEAVDAFGAFAGDVWDRHQEQQGGDFPFFDNEQFLADRNDPSWEASVSLSGGSEEGIDYYSSIFAKDETGIIENTGFEKQSLRLNLTREFSDRFDISFSSNLIRTEARRGLTNNDNSQTSYYMVLTATPSFIDLRENPDGTFPFNPFAGGGSNPLQTAALMDKSEEVFRLIGSTNVNATLIEGDAHEVRLVGTAGIDWFGQRNDIFSPPRLHFEDNDGLLGTKVVHDASNLQHNTNVNAVWDFQPSEGTTFTTSAGFQFEFSELEGTNKVGENLTGGKDKVDAGTVISIRANKERTEDFGFYLQEQVLTFDQRLSLTGAVRFDQSSANSDNEELFIFPHAAASFRFPDLGGFADELKLRAAFGQTGNRPLFGQEFTSLRLTENIQGIPGFTIQGSVADPDLEPERQTEIEAGFDLQAFDGRLSLETTGYWQFIDNLILQRTLAPSSGFDSKFFNGGQLQNRGIEVAVDGAPIQTPDFGWSTRVSFDLNRNEVTDLPVTPFTQGSFGETLGTFCVDEGSSLNDIVGTNPNLSDEEADQCGLDKLGEATPDFSLSFSHDIRWKGFRLYQFWDWRPGFEVINLTELLADAFGVSQDFEDPDGEVSPVTECFPDCSGLERIVGFSEGFARGYTQAASFIKLREVSLSWQVPDNVVQSLWSGFESVRLTLSGRDLLTETPYRGLDPEVSNFGRENFARNVDVAPFPPSRSFWFGTEVTF